jgi:hypothetical protein
VRFTCRKKRSGEESAVLEGSIARRLRSEPETILKSIKPKQFIQPMRDDTFVAPGAMEFFLA